MAVPMEPSKTLAAAMKASDVIIITTNLEWANRFAHVNPVAESCALGAKIGSVEEGMADWDLTFDDIDAIVGRAEKLIAAMEGAEWCRVTNPSGTDVRICIEDRPPLKVVPIKGAGEMMGPVPLWGEVAYAAREDKTVGTIVVDGIMLGVGVYGSLKEPITWTIEDGRAVKIEGGPEAERLSERHRRFRRHGRRGRRVRHRHEPQGGLRLTLGEGHDGHDALRPGRQLARLSGRTEPQPVAPRRLGTRRDHRGRREGRHQGRCPCHLRCRRE